MSLENLHASHYGKRNWKNRGSPRLLFLNFMIKFYTKSTQWVNHSARVASDRRPREGQGERSSMTSAGGPEVRSRRPPHAQETTLCVIIVASRPESVLPDVLAMHTIEMIPKSMILICNQI